MQVDITNNEEFKYYNNCYNILPQVCKVVNSHCKLSNSFRPSVKVLLTNPRLEVASLQPNSSVALVKVHKVRSVALVTVHKVSSVAQVKVYKVGLGLLL